MKTWVRKTLSVGVLAAGALLFAPGAAHADTHQNSYDNNGILNGTQFFVPVSMPVNIVGNSDALLGHANAAGVGTNWWTEGGHVSQDTSHNNGIANGTQVYFPINVPVNIVGNSDALLGHANAAGSGVNGRKTEGANMQDRHRPDQDSSDNNGILNGTQFYAPYSNPVNICGNSFALLGLANSQAICSNGGVRGKHGTESGHAVSQDSSDNNGILNGTQIYAPYSMPVNLAGNSDAFLGHANAAASAVNESDHGHGFDQDTSDNNGILNGTQIAVPISMPINICGNALGFLGGAANASAACANGVAGDHGHGHAHGNNGGDHGNNGDDNGGVNGDDTDYLGDHGQGNGDANANPDGNGAANGDAGYGGVNDATSTGGSTGGRGRSGSEASAVDGLTQRVGGAGAAGLGGVDLLSTLR
jgi:hypothetical protein